MYKKNARFQVYDVLRNQTTRFFVWLCWGFIVIGYTAPVLADMPSESEKTVHKVYLRHHDFEFETYHAAPGDIIEIINASDISHSVYIETPSNDIINIDQKIYVQTPGVSIRWQVPEIGQYALRCWIHPIINAKLIIVSSASQ